MDLDKLRTFVLAAERGGLTAAGEALHRSLPALSRRLGLLEEELGVALLERRGRRLVLTPAGRTFLPRARRLLDDLDDALLGLKGAAGARLAGSVAIACIPSAVRLVSRAIAAFGAAHPLVQVRLLDMATSRALDAVGSGEAEFGVALADLTHPDVVFHRLVEDRFALLVPRGHPMAQRDEVGWAELAEERLIGFSRRSGNRVLIERVLAPHGIGLRHAVEVEHMLSAVDLVEAGAGVAALPHLALPALTPRLALAKLVAPVVTRDAGLLLRQGATLPPAAQALRAAVESAAAAEAGQPSIGKSRPKRRAQSTAMS